MKTRTNKTTTTKTTTEKCAMCESTAHRMGTCAAFLATLEN